MLRGTVGQEQSPLLGLTVQCEKSMPGAGVHSRAEVGGLQRWEEYEDGRTVEVGGQWRWEHDGGGAR